MGTDLQRKSQLIAICMNRQVVIMFNGRTIERELQNVDIVCLNDQYLLFAESMVQHRNPPVPMDVDKPANAHLVRFTLSRRITAMENSLRTFHTSLRHQPVVEVFRRTDRMAAIRVLLQ